MRGSTRIHLRYYGDENILNVRPKYPSFHLVHSGIFKQILLDIRHIVGAPRLGSTPILTDPPLVCPYHHFITWALQYRKASMFIDSIRLYRCDLFQYSRYVGKGFDQTESDNGRR